MCCSPLSEVCSLKRNSIVRIMSFSWLSVVCSRSPPLSDVSSAYMSPPETAGVHRGLGLTDRLSEPPREEAESSTLLKKGLRAGKETSVMDVKCSMIVQTAGFQSPQV